MDFKNIKTQFKISNVLTNKRFVIEAFKNNINCGNLTFEISDSLNGYFAENEPQKYIIFNDLIFENNKKTKFIYLNAIIVENKYQNIGLSNELMSYFLKFVENKLLINKILLNACPFNYGKTKPLPLNILIKFYEKFGFVNIINEVDGALMFKNI